jgi:hypothetical protein
MDILDISQGIIAHQVNCQRVAGAGLAFQIAKKYPEWYKHFKNVDPYLGLADLYNVNSKLKIASLYGQDEYGYGKRFTNYHALELCLEKLHNMIENNVVYFPYKMGCGLGGGEWMIVKQIIEIYFKPNEYKIVALDNSQ